jgi:hypothetical protein
VPRKSQPDERLSESSQSSVGVQMPDALHERIEQLSEAVRDAGHRRPTKREMISALVLASPVDGDELAAVIQVFHRACVRDALVACDDTTDVIEFSRRRPGPRKRRGG